MNILGSRQRCGRPKGLGAAHACLYCALNLALTQGTFLTMKVFSSFSSSDLLENVSDR